MSFSNNASHSKSLKTVEAWEDVISVKPAKVTKFDDLHLPAFGVVHDQPETKYVKTKPSKAKAVDIYKDIINDHRKSPPTSKKQGLYRDLMDMRNPEILSNSKQVHSLYVPISEHEAALGVIWRLNASSNSDQPVKDAKTDMIHENSIDKTQDSASNESHATTIRNDIYNDISSRSLNKEIKRFSSKDTLVHQNEDIRLEVYDDVASRSVFNEIKEAAEHDQIYQEKEKRSKSPKEAREGKFGPVYSSSDRLVSSLHDSDSSIASESELLGSILLNDSTHVPPPKSILSLDATGDHKVLDDTINRDIDINTTDNFDPNNSSLLHPQASSSSSGIIYIPGTTSNNTTLLTPPSFKSKIPTSSKPPLSSSLRKQGVAVSPSSSSSTPIAISSRVVDGKISHKPSQLPEKSILISSSTTMTPKPKIGHYERSHLIPTGPASASPPSTPPRAIAIASSKSDAHIHSPSRINQTMTATNTSASSTTIVSSVLKRKTSKAMSLSSVGNVSPPLVSSLTQRTSSGIRSSSSGIGSRDSKDTGLSKKKSVNFVRSSEDLNESNSDQSDPATTNSTKSSVSASSTSPSPMTPISLEKKLSSVSDSKASPGIGLPQMYEKYAGLVINKQELQLYPTPIGEGFFGVVYRAKWNDLNVAVKKIKHDMNGNGNSNNDGNQKDDILKEVSSLSKLRHPNIVLFYGLTAPPNSYIVSELLACSLFQLIHRNVPFEITLPISSHNSADDTDRGGKDSDGGLDDAIKQLKPIFPWCVIARILKDVASGGHYLHTRDPSIIHRDMSTSNILLSIPANSSIESLVRACLDDSRPLAKLTDFGLSRNVERYMTACVGNCLYLAPEIFAGDKYTESADIYSFAIVMWELTHRRPPHETLTPQRVAFLACTSKLRPSHSRLSEIPPSIIDLINACWDQDASSRPSFKDIRQLLSDIDISLYYGGNAQALLQKEMESQVKFVEQESSERDIHFQQQTHNGDYNQQEGKVNGKETSLYMKESGVVYDEFGTIEETRNEVAYQSPMSTLSRSNCSSPASISSSSTNNSSTKKKRDRKINLFI